jgi:hypothetical protein
MADLVVLSFKTCESQICHLNKRLLVAWVVFCDNLSFRHRQFLQYVSHCVNESWRTADVECALFIVKDLVFYLGSVDEASVSMLGIAWL